MAVKRIYNERLQFFDANGDPLSGGLLFFYIAGSSTRTTTYNSSAGSVANSNPMEMDSAGRLQSECWVTVGESVKVVLANAGDGGAITDPSSPIWTEDNISGINDTTVSIDEWVAGPTPTYVSSTSFTVIGDQTSTLAVGRALKIIDAGGTKYGWIKTSAYTTLTTIVLDQNSDALSSPISSISYGLLQGTDNSSTPVLPDNVPLRGGSSDRSKQASIETDQNTTAQTRQGLWPDYNFRFATQTHGADVASATTTNLDTASGDLIDVTGTTTITGITLAEGKEATVRFTGALILTHGASLILPGAANITTEAGDFATFRGYASSVVRMTKYQRLNARMMVDAITSNTAVATTSGTTVSLATGIPTWAKRITLLFDSVSSNGTNEYLVQLGDSGGFETSGYVSESAVTTAAATGVSTSTAGFIIRTVSAANSNTGRMVLELSGTANTWVGMHAMRQATNSLCYGAGIKATSTTMDRIQITTVGGTDTFDAGSITVLFE